MTEEEKARAVLFKKFEDAYIRCRTDPMEGLSFTEEEMIAAVTKSLDRFKTPKETRPGQERRGPSRKVKKKYLYYEEDEEEEGDEEYDNGGVWSVGARVCSSLSFLICKYPCPLIKRKYLYFNIIC